MASLLIKFGLVPVSRTHGAGVYYSFRRLLTHTKISTLSCNGYKWSVVCVLKWEILDFLDMTIFPRFQSSGLPCHKTCIAFTASLLFHGPAETRSMGTCLMFSCRGLISEPGKTVIVDSKFASCKSLWSAFVSLKGNYWVTVSIKSCWWGWWVTILVLICHLITKRSIVQLCRRWWVRPITLLASLGSLVIIANQGRMPVMFSPERLIVCTWSLIDTFSFGSPTY